MSAGPRLWDISPPLSADTPVYPGDAPFGLRWTAPPGPGVVASVSAITLSPHAGAHADAPLHLDPAGLPVGALDLAPYLGPCRVIHAIGRGPRVGLADLAHALGRASDLPPRVLVRTARQAATVWTTDFAALEPALVDALADLGVVLVGLDTPSLDPADSADLPAHRRLFARGLRVLENLVLDAVEEGDYELIALPLRLAGAEASPVRAVLRRAAG